MYFIITCVKKTLKVMHEAIYNKGIQGNYSIH